MQSDLERSPPDLFQLNLESLYDRSHQDRNALKEKDLQSKNFQPKDFQPKDFQPNEDNLKFQNASLKSLSDSLGRETDTNYSNFEPGKGALG